MTDDERAAAERAVKRMRSVDLNYFPAYPGGQKQFDEDCQVLAAAYLRDHADDATAIDEEWLRSVGGIRHDQPAKITFHTADAMSIGLWCVDDGWKVMLIHHEHAASCIVRGLKTRSDVRLLCRALGIELKEPSHE